ncbi:hypothetical protein [uncultured Treponema sp.]|uniref:hypothetical protein n=1 Tax=uncultured Treponema sp. TaxID=162155 RepID=UPI0025FF9C66|nr:hypothetical protein [uncultured Treponema sp.]
MKENEDDFPLPKEDFAFFLDGIKSFTRQENENPSVKTQKNAAHIDTKLFGSPKNISPSDKKTGFINGKP